MQTQIMDGPANRIARLIERLGRLSRACESTGDLNPAQWDALRYLARANRFSRRPSAVATWLATTKGTTSQTLMALERKGLITRSAHGHDRRGAILDLTERGRDMLAADPLEALSTSIARLPPLHAAALSQSLVHILDDLTRVDGRPGFEGCATCEHLRPGRTEDEPSTCLRFDAALLDGEVRAICAHHTQG